MADDAGPPKVPGHTERRLAALGVFWPQLWSAIKAGEEARQTAIEEEPTVSGGIKDWIARVGTLRSLLVAEGWTLLNNYQIPLVVNPDRTIAIGVLLGDEDTAGPAPGPSSKYPKGPKVKDRARQNEALFPTSQARSDHMDSEEYARLSTWLLVTYRFVIPGTLPEPSYAGIRSELSLPGDATGQDKSFQGAWLDRIPLPPLQFTIEHEPPEDDDPRHVVF